MQNLADSKDHEGVRARLSRVLEQHLARTYDVGFLPEAELRRRSQEQSPWAMARDPEAYPYEEIHRAAELATGRKSAGPERLRPLLGHTDPAVRYWGVVGWLQPGVRASPSDAKQLARLLDDEVAAVAVAAAEWNARYGKRRARRRALDLLFAPPTSTANRLRSSGKPSTCWTNWTSWRSR